MTDRAGLVILAELLPLWVPTRYVGEEGAPSTSAPPAPAANAANATHGDTFVGSDGEEYEYVTDSSDDDK